MRKKDQQRKYFLVLVVGVVVGAIGVGLFSTGKSGIPLWRRPASSQSGMPVPAALLIKTEMIQSLQWVDKNQEMELRVGGKDPQFCEKWSELTVTLAADGVAISGEAPLATATTTSCLDRQFVLSWPKSQREWRGNIQKRGDYFSEPLDFYVSQILLTGGFGQMKISNLEIETVLNKTLTISSLGESASPADANH